jgi:hypothetical protein
VDLDQLKNRRAGVESTLSAETKTRRLARACAIADLVSHNNFIEDRAPLEEENVEDEDMGDAEDVPKENPAAGSSVPPAGPPRAGA